MAGLIMVETGGLAAKEKATWKASREADRSTSRTTRLAAAIPYVFSLVERASLPSSRLPEAGRKMSSAQGAAMAYKSGGRRAVALVIHGRLLLPPESRWACLLLRSGGLILAMTEACANVERRPSPLPPEHVI